MLLQTFIHMNKLFDFIIKSDDDPCKFFDLFYCLTSTNFFDALAELAGFRLIKL